ncbi:MATH domain and coiled-coil domain-containing protein At3g58400-like isoform X3 [Rhododendron vialii]|uniref:MATH domain and coiled-coil domain-containing protein At3g58400-like isoform X3 n=1 Tax=Rhododendron vialii TaxID=182163 RepID=UPI00265FF3DC|nr:MATH domain and coiled-coil domain-containing protein At3g58400-like isoform X3 [Rhododendron vialii]
MLERSTHPILDYNSEVARSLREIPPAHYTLKIKSFSLLSQMLLDTQQKNFESAVFEANGYKWKLSLYPHGDKERNGEGHISLYLVIADRDNLPLGWEVNVNFKLFVFDQIQDKYMTVQDVNGKVRRFHKMKTKWGFTQLLPLSSFSDAANGYLINDMCVFGVEIFVVSYNGRGECLNLLKVLDTTYAWNIEKFSSLQDEYHYSDVFTIGQRKWKLQLFPKANSRGKGKSMSLFILLDDLETFPSGQKINATYKLRIKNQYHDKHGEITGTNCFSATSCGRGCSSLLSLTDLHDASKGFLVNNSLMIEAEVSAISTVKNFSE